MFNKSFSYHSLVGVSQRPRKPEVLDRWYNDTKIVRQLPIHYRGYGLYRRWMANHSTRPIRGGFFLIRTLIWLTKILGLKNYAQIHVEDTTFLIDLCDVRMLRVLNEIQGTNHESKIIHSSLSQGDTFIDAGANHGCYSLIAAKLVGPTGLVVAFEPQPRLATLIRKAFKANHMANCEIHEVACSDQEGTAKFYIPSLVGSGCAGLYERFSATLAHREITVRTAKFDEVVAWESFPGNVFLKLDVEGSEFSFLLGAEKMIRRRRPVILFEVNPSSAHAAGRSIQETVNLLRWLGYEWFSEIDRYPNAIALEEVNCKRPRNLVAFPLPRAEKGLAKASLNTMCKFIDNQLC